MTHRIVLGGLVLALAASAVGAGAQDGGLRVASGAVYRSFSLDPQLSAQSASLLLVPVAAQLPVGRSLQVEVYAAWARGAIERGGETLTLTGPVNANLRGVWAATPWARVTLGLSLPTGDAAREADEAQVAAILSTDLLGFREASFGVGTAVTTGLAFAHQLGDWGVGYGGSYRLAGEFEPRADTALTYAPGSQVVLRVAADRNVGASGKLTLGASYQHFADDEFASNLFHPGPRIRADASYAFRTGPTSTWSVFASDIWRQQSDATLGAGVDTTVAGSQNVVVLGTAGSIELAGKRLLPRADVRVLGREDGIASGWLGAVGLGVAFGAGSVQAVPRARALFGAIEAASGDRPGITGFEVELTLRWGGAGR